MKQQARGRRSLRTILLTTIGGVAVGAVVVTAALTIGIVNLTAERTARAELRRDVEVAARRIERMGRRPMMQLPACRVLPALGISEVCVSLSGAEPPEIQGLVSPEGRATIDGQEVFYATRPVVVGGRPATVYGFRPVSTIVSPARGLTGGVLVAALAALALSAAVAYALAGRISRPLRELARAAPGLAHGHQPVDAGGAGPEPQEVGELRDAFADLARNLTEARERERSFLMSVSHELRTPLTAIRGYGEALVDGTARGAPRAGGVIVGESRRLERLVQDLLDLARIQAGEFGVAREETDPGRIAMQAVDALRPRARESGVTLEVREDPVASLVVTDADRTHQMLANLLENALRVTPAGGRVAVTVDGATVEVADSGPGLERDDIEHAFDRFYLWRKYRGERPVGSGLGLAVVGELARLLDVKVEVTSEPGAGTVFRLTFPAAA